jgi:hypothetical protein
VGGRDHDGQRPTAPTLKTQEAGFRAGLFVVLG